MSRAPPAVKYRKEDSESVAAWRGWHQDQRVRLRNLAFATALLAATALPAGAATAPLEDPYYLTAHVDDRADVLSASQETRLNDAITQLSDTTDVDLYVVYVDTFSNQTAADWVYQTAVKSNLGVNDVLLAVAVEDRAYAVSSDNMGVTSESRVDSIMESQVVPYLGRDDWGGAGVAFADGLRSAYSPSSFPIGLLVGAAAVVAGLMFVFSRRKRAKGERKAADPSELSLKQLSAKAGSALVQIDDELRASEQELGFAQAEFGLQATAPFTKALEDAKARVGRAFEIRKILDDHIEETEAEQRRLLTEIITIAEEIHTSLSAQKKSFDDLRAMESRAAEVLDEMKTRAGEVAGTVEGAKSIVAALSAQYSEAALTTVSRAPERAGALIRAAEAAIEEGRSQLSSDDKSAAVANARIAEQAIDQAAQLIGTVHGASTLLEEAKPKIQSRIGSLTSDVKDANRLAATDQVVSAARVEAQAAIAEGIDATRGGDPLAALTRLESAETALDQALEPFRAQEVVAQRAATQVEQRRTTVEQRVARLEGYITANRGGLDVRPRTLISEAKRHLKLSETITDPKAALREISQASELVSEATDEAERQLRPSSQFGYDTNRGGRGGGIDIGSLILGGILGDMFDNDYDDRRRGGGTWGGSWGGSRSSGQRSSGGSWGGSRGQRSSGGGSWGGSRSSSSGSFGRSRGFSGGGGSRTSRGGRF